jgi:hypothetical protein
MKNHAKLLAAVVGAKRVAHFEFRGTCQGIHLYRHRVTRKFLNVDEARQTFRFVPPTRYVPIDSRQALADVLDGQP